jgi:hypothetical protein
MKQLGLGWVGAIPEQSLTGRLLLAREVGARARNKGIVRAEAWFEDAPPLLFWEEVKVFGNTGRALTFLALRDRAGASQRAGRSCQPETLSQEDWWPSRRACREMG